METLTLIKLLENLCRECGMSDEEKVMREVFEEQTQIHRASLEKTKKIKSQGEPERFVTYQSYRSGPLQV